MKIPGTGHGRDMVENFLQDTHFGEFWPLIPKVLYAHWWVPPIGETANMRLGVGEPPHWRGVGRGAAEFECHDAAWGVLV